MESNSSSSYFGSLSFEQVLDDLSSRFIVNLPAEELESIERICFQIEQAHWYYEDFVRPQASHLPSFSLRKFSEIIFKSNPLLSHFDAATAYDQFLRYKERVPVCGAILISSNWDKCLVVKGWKAGASWSFPRGKINQGEEERDCAVREVWEETGYDISPHFNPSVVPHKSDSATCPPPLPPGDYPEDDYLECVMKEQRIRLYLVPGVSEDTLFETKTRKEISKIAWAPFTSLPTWTKKGKGTKKEIKCYMVTPFVNPLKEWIRTHQKQRAHPSNPKARLHESVLEEEHSTSSTPDIQLAAQTQALQEFFFGSQPPAVPSTSNYEPSTNIASSPSSAQASQSEHLQSSSYLLPAQSSSYPLPAQSSSSSPTSQAQARYLQNLEVLSPLPQSPSRPVDTLHRLVVRRGYDTQAQTAHASSSSRAGESTSNAGHAARAPPTLDHPFSSVGSPSFTDYRNTALSPSNFNMHPDSTASPRRPIYTEAEREEARRDLLSQLASQLGNPSPPSADEGTDETDTSGEEVEGTSRQATPVLDLLALVQSQQANGQSHARGLSQPPDLAPVTETTNSTRAGEGQTTWDQSTSKQPVFPHPTPSMHMLGILNGSATHSQVQTTLSNSPSTHTTHLKQQQATSLLNLFNSKSSVSSPASNPVLGNQSGSADLARLFANIRT